MNIEVKSISQTVDEATASQSAAPEQPIEDRRALIAELHQIKNVLEAKLPAMALVRVTNLLRRLDQESSVEEHIKGMMSAGSGDE